MYSAILARDQLSVNFAFRHAGLTPDVMIIDNLTSWFHSWPHTKERYRNQGMRYSVNSLIPTNIRIHHLEQALTEHQAN